VAGINDSELSFTNTGHLFINSGDDPELLVDWILQSGYGEEYCFAVDFDPLFIADLIAAGFLVMSVRLNFNGKPSVLLMPKHHLRRDVLFFEDLHRTKSANRFINRYELRAGTDFDRIMDNCAAAHGDDWLTPELTGALRELRRRNHPLVKPWSFGVYRDGVLKAGEFGVVTGGIYTSYSGYHGENNSGTVQLILTALYLRSHNYAFWDLGMPLPYKTNLGARTLDIGEFIHIWRKGRKQVPVF
jgi:Leu/Phe-tRNA-protein transferase